MIGNHNDRLPSRRRPVATVLAATALVCGCAVLQRLSFENPSIGLAAVRIASITLDGGTLELLLDVHNPNPYRITGSQFEGEMLLEETAFGTVTRDAAWALPAEADTTLALRLAFGWSAVGAAARGLLERGSVGYTLTGRVLIGTPVDERWVRISRRGDVPLERIRP